MADANGKRCGFTTQCEPTVFRNRLDDDAANLDISVRTVEIHRKNINANSAFPPPPA